MSFLLKGKLTDSNSKPLAAHTIKVYDKDPWPGSIDDDYIDSMVTLEDGTFRLQFTKEQFKKPLEWWDKEDDPDLYFKIEDPLGNDITDNNDLLLDTGFTPFVILQSDKFEVVVVGSGFGGTILTLSWVNKLYSEDTNNGIPDANRRKICLLERGQWWISHEIPASQGFNEVRNLSQPNLGLREYLEENDIPYRLWPFPDNLNGLTQIVDATRLKDRRGLYDYRAFPRVHTLAASGMGGGSLIYTNVTEEPDPNVVNGWDTQLGLGIDYNGLKPYFDMARAFIGVNKITTTTGLGTFKLPRTKIFQDAAEKVRAQLPAGVVKNPPTPTSGPYKDVYAVDLSITDFPQAKDVKSIFQTSGLDFQSVKTTIQAVQFQEELAKLFRKYSAEPNVCERQGRCALGCIPGARHTNNKKIFDFLKDKNKKKNLEVRALCEVVDIEPINDPNYQYRVYYTDYSARDVKQKTFSWNDSQSGKNYSLGVKMFRWAKIPSKKTVKCNKLFLTAGAIGSTEILFKATNSPRTTGQKLVLSNMLGKQYSTNGDLLGVVARTKEDVAMTRGPIVTSHIRFDEGGFKYTIEDSGLPKMFSGISRMLSNGGLLRTALNFVGMGRGQDVLNTITENLPAPLPNLNIPIQIAEQDLSHTMLFAGMGTDNSDGMIKVSDDWKNNPNRDLDRLGVIEVQYDLNLLQPLFGKMRSSMEKLAEHIGDNTSGKINFDTPLWNPSDPNQSSTIVLHNLGGCCMGSDRNSGVVNTSGLVFNGQASNITDTYPDLYVVDGGIIPTSLGINSSLTISALAFRIAEQLVGPTFLPIEKITLGALDFYLPKDPSL